MSWDHPRAHTPPPAPLLCHRLWSHGPLRPRRLCPLHRMTSLSVGTLLGSYVCTPKRQQPRATPLSPRRFWPGTSKEAHLSPVDSSIHHESWLRLDTRSTEARISYMFGYSFSISAGRTPNLDLLQDAQGPGGQSTRVSKVENTKIDTSLCRRHSPWFSITYKASTQ